MAIHVLDITATGLRWPPPCRCEPTEFNGHVQDKVSLTALHRFPVGGAGWTGGSQWCTISNDHNHSATPRGTQQPNSGQPSSVESCP